MGILSFLMIEEVRDLYTEIGLYKCWYMYLIIYHVTTIYSKPVSQRILFWKY